MARTGGGDGETGTDPSARRRVVIVGQGYVGLPLAIRAAEVGHSVIGFDIDKSIIDRLTDGDSHIEDLSDTRLQAALTSGAYEPTADSDLVSGFDIGVISVPTPLREGQPDLTFV